MECNIFVLSVLKINSFSYSFQSIFYFYLHCQRQMPKIRDDDDSNIRLMYVCVCVCEFDFIQQLAWCWWQYLKIFHTLFNRNFQFSHLIYVCFMYSNSTFIITKIHYFFRYICNQWMFFAKKQLFIHQNVALKTVVICCLSKYLDFKKLQSWCQTLISLSFFHKIKIENEKKQNKNRKRSTENQTKSTNYRIFTASVLIMRILIL